MVMNEENKQHEAYSSINFQKDLSKIHASEELKFNTKKYIQKKAKRKGWHPGNRFSYVPVLLSLMFIIIGAGAFLSYHTPVATISVDVNPSLELKLNSWNYVVEVVPYNEDAQNIIDSLPLCNKRMESSISTLLADSLFSQYLKENGDLTFTIVSKNKEKYEDILTNHFQYNIKNVTIVKSDDNTLNEAHRHHLSVGKYYAYKQLSSYDTSIDIEDCRHMTMHEIHTKIQEHCNDKTDDIHKSDCHDEDISTESNNENPQNHTEGEKEKHHSEDHSSHHSK